MKLTVLQLMDFILKNNVAPDAIICIIDNNEGVTRESEFDDISYEEGYNKRFKKDVKVLTISGQ